MSHRQTTQLGDDGRPLPIVNIMFELEHAVRDDVYAYFEGGVYSAASFVA